MNQRPPIEAWRRHLDDLRRETLDLLGLVSEETAAAFAHPDWSPLRWHLGHIAYTESLWVRQTLRGLPPLDEKYERLFDNIHTPREARGDLPALADIRRYAEEVRRETSRYLEEAPWDGGNPLLAGGYIVDFLWEHEAQHQENMTVVLTLLPADAKRPPPFLDPPRVAGSREMIHMAGGDFVIGASEQGFSYDNERPPRKVCLRDFWIDAAPVTNLDYLLFLEDRGYEDPSLWSDQGWSWRERTGAHAPLHWRAGDVFNASTVEKLNALRNAAAGGGPRRIEPRAFPELPPDARTTLVVSGERASLPVHELRMVSQWHERLPFGEASLRPDNPVTGLSRHEAEAYARWAGKRLPTEEEWEYAAAWDPATGRVRRYPWGDDPPTPERANFARRYFGTTPVGAFPEGRSACGALDMGGNVWEWTSSSFSPYPGFIPDAYRDYSQPFFDGTYAVLRGGSWATQGPLLRCSFRNWYPPDVREILAGFRCARDA